LNELNAQHIIFFYTYHTRMPYVNNAIVSLLMRLLFAKCKKHIYEKKKKLSYFNSINIANERNELLFTV